MQVVKDEAAEIDQQSIGLIGVRERNQKIQSKNPYFQKDDILQLNPRCFNCVGSNGRDRQAILECFKLACLNYQPSQITYKNEMLER